MLSLACPGGNELLSNASSLLKSHEGNCDGRLLENQKGMSTYIVPKMHPAA